MTAGATLGRARAQLASGIGRNLRVRGVDRVLRALYSPDRRGGSHVEAEVEIWDGTRFHVDTRSFIEWYLFVYGEYEEYLQRAMRAHLRPGDVVVDCGANVGVHTCSLARAVGPTGRVIAIEPIAEVGDRLLRNCELNGLTNVTLVLKAASSARAETQIFAPPADASNRGQATLHRRPGVAERETAVAVDTIDNVLAEHRVDAVRLVKIDVEGHELEALRGAEQSLRRSSPYVYFEFDALTFRAAGVSWRDTAAFLAGLGYGLRELTGRGELREVAGDEPCWSCMIVAVPERADGARAGAAG